MNVRRLGLFLGIAVCWMLPTAPAEAQYGGFPGMYYNGVPYNIYAQDPIPYFALHPPVYYSPPRSRPYGLSPFAYPPGSMVPSQPQMVINTFVTDRDIPPAAPIVAPMPLTIENPFFTGNKDSQGALPAPQVETPKPANR